MVLWKINVIQEILKEQWYFNINNYDNHYFPEVKPFKYSSKDKFVNTMEINLDMAGNAQAKGIEALDEGNVMIGHCHLANLIKYLSLSNFRKNKN
jgi:hypothetical protein